MSGEKSKRELPPALVQLLTLDTRLSKEVVEAVNRKYPIVNFRHNLKHLEISCHGIPWFFLTFAGLYLFDRPELWVNLLIGLIIDIVIVALLKAFTRRRRPAYNIDDNFVAPSVDKFSFPSGHATRAILLAIFFCCLYPLHAILILPIVVWSLAVCASRVILGRHHLLDVACGILIGVVEAVLLACCWRSAESAAALVSALGGEDPWSSG